MEKVIGSAMLKMGIIRERRLKQSQIKSRSKLGAPAGIPAQDEHQALDKDDAFAEAMTIEDLIAELEEMEEFHLENEWWTIVEV